MQIFLQFLDKKALEDIKGVSDVYTKKINGHVTHNNNNRKEQTMSLAVCTLFW